MLAPGAYIELVPEKAVAGGSMLARHEGHVVLVRGAIPGERVQARVERLSRHVAHAIVTDVKHPADDRRQPPVDPFCGGNAFAHIAYNRQLALKAEIITDAFGRLARIAVPSTLSIAASPERGYRMRTRFHVRGGRAGFYREGSHSLCDPGTSGQLQPEGVIAIQTVAQTLHDPKGCLDAVVSVDLAENISAEMRALHVELHHAKFANRLAKLQDLERVTGLSWSATDDGRTQIASGTPYVVDALDIAPLTAGVMRPIRIRRHVRAFFQTNRYLLSELVQRVLTHVPEGGVVDLYAGVGLFALALAATRSDEVVAVERDGISAADLAANAADCERPFTWRRLSVEEFLQKSRSLAEYTIVLDPPRTGLSRDAAEALLQHRPARVVYVSCDVATLARDVKMFVAAGYSLAHVEAFDLFPNTAHIETLAVLDRG